MTKPYLYEYGTVLTKCIFVFIQIQIIMQTNEAKCISCYTIQIKNSVIGIIPFPAGIYIPSDMQLCHGAPIGNIDVGVKR